MTFNLNGINVEITFLFVAFISFIISLNAPSNVLITVMSSLFHEVGHLSVMCATGNKPQKLRFELTGINIIRNQATTVSVKNDLLISLGGPMANAILLAISCVVLCFISSEIVMTAACINLILMTFNLLPIKSLDGGMALYFLLSQKFQIETCLRILKVTSAVFITLIYIWGVYIFIASKYNISLIIIAIFLTLSMFRNNEY